jgi:hypothetical protein
MAAEHNYAEAQANLGAMYSRGKGVPEDLVRAHMWFTLASAQGSLDAQKGLDSITREMTPDQIAEAQRLVKEWRPK